MDSVIALVGHVALRVRDLETAVPYSSELFGLKVTGEADDRVYLTEGAPHHSLVYVAAEEDALDHVGLLATDGNALAEIKQRAERGGFEILSDEPLNPATGEALVIEGPENFVFEVSVGQEKLPPEQRPLGALPKRFGHVNFVTDAGKEVVDFLIGVFDFRMSDEVAGGAGSSAAMSITTASASFRARARVDYIITPGRLEASRISLSLPTGSTNVENQSCGVPVATRSAAISQAMSMSPAASSWSSMRTWKGFTTTSPTLRVIGIRRMGTSGSRFGTLSSLMAFWIWGCLRSRGRRLLVRAFRTSLAEVSHPLHSGAADFSDPARDEVAIPGR